MNEFTPMIRIETSPVNEARDLRDGETMQDLINSGVSVSQHDQDNWDKVPAGMVFRKIGVPTDMWYVNREYLNQTYRKIDSAKDSLAEKINGIEVPVRITKVNIEGSEIDITALSAAMQESLKNILLNEVNRIEIVVHHNRRTSGELTI